MTEPVRLCRYWSAQDQTPHVGQIVGDQVFSLTARDPEAFASFVDVLQEPDLVGRVSRADAPRATPGLRYSDLDRVPSQDEPYLLAPITTREVWACGETYERDASDAPAADPFDRAYLADRPELFFKATPSRVVGPNEPIRARADAALVFPEPELVLILNRDADIVAYTVGHDVTAYDLCDENILYMPQVKVYDGSCALGPTFVLASTVDFRTLTIHMTVTRAGRVIYEGGTPLSRLIRPFTNVISYLFREQHFDDGVLLMTGLGFDLPRGFTIRADDIVEMTPSVIGTLRNRVR